jgi:protoheme IX farnesyltransferase
VVMTETRSRFGFAAWAGHVPAASASRVWDFVALMKPRPMSVVVFTAIAGLIAAPSAISPITAVIAVCCIALGGGGSAVLNMWYERDLDARMARTASRPLPAGRVTPDEALFFALLLICFSVAVMAWAVNPAAAVMLALTILFYGVVYTIWLKRLTALNVVIGGGLASLLTPLTGWVSASGSVSIEALALFAFLVPWTPPHVWSQALVRSSDYANAQVPMMPVVAGSARTRWLIVGFTVAHTLLAFVPWVMGQTGLAWAVAAVLGGGVLVIESLRLALTRAAADEHRLAWRFYRLNSIYVMALFAVLIIERWLGVVVSSPIAGLSG